MCSSPDPTEEALKQSQAAFTSTLQNSFQSAFGANQAILGTLTNALKAQVANPQGFTPAALTAMRTGATDTIASQTNNATIAANNYIATHGGSDLGSGVNAQIQGGVQVAGMQQQAGEQNQITLANAQQQQQNYWNAISGLTNVGNAYNPQGYASAETNSANATTTAANAVAAEKQQGWQNAFGVVQGVAGLATAAAGLPDFGGGSGGGSNSAGSQTPGGVPIYGS